jgi:hypothetical protein
MRIILLMSVILIWFAPGAWPDTGLGTSPFSTGGKVTADQMNAINNAINALYDQQGDFYSEYVDEDTAADFRTAVGLTIGTDVLSPTGDGSGLTGVNAGGYVGKTITALTVGDATPEVEHTGWYDCTGATAITITDFCGL